VSLADQEVMLTGSAYRIALRDQVLATLGAARVEHGPSAARFHACAETMRTRMLEIAWLESALHDSALRDFDEKEAGI
jgi:hypothetical protein